MATFEELGLQPEICKAVNAMKFEKATPIQEKAIPLTLAGKDLIGIAKTGSGKTAACAIPACHKIDPEQKHIQTLVIVPTRELALQYTLEAHNVGKYKRIKAFSIYGGQEASIQKSKLNHGVHFLIATPGRLIDFIYSRSIDLSHVHTLVLDEADEMLSMGFFDDLEFIINCLTQEHQTLLFSATMPPSIRNLAKQYMKNPEEVTFLQGDSAPQKIDHYFQYCPHHQREKILSGLLDKFTPKQAIIFCHTRNQCETVTRYLRQSHKAVDYLHAGIAQDLRNRITDRFRTGKIRYLVATDLVARGLDFSGVTHVFIFQLSDDPDVYIHRSGRTGRQERSGVTVTLVTRREVHTLNKILERLKKKPNWIGDPPVFSSNKKRSSAKRGSRPKKTS